MQRACEICGNQTSIGYHVMAHLKKYNAIYYCEDHRDRVVTLCMSFNMLSVPRLAQRKSLQEKYTKAWSKDLDIKKFPHPNSLECDTQ